MFSGLVPLRILLDAHFLHEFQTGNLRIHLDLSVIVESFLPRRGSYAHESNPRTIGARPISSTFSASVTVAFLLRARVFRRLFFALHSTRNASVHPKLSMHLNLHGTAPAGGLLINYLGIPGALQERRGAESADGSFHPSAPTAGLVRSRGFAIRIQFGRTLWRSLHGLADRWPCDRCRPSLVVWMQGLHDAVNVRLGKRPFRPDAFQRYASGSLEGRFHLGCFSCRFA